MSAKHEFAFFVPDLKQSAKSVHSQVIIDDHALITRLVHVVRLQVNEHCVLFDESVHAHCSVQEIAKKQLKLSVLAVAAHKPLKPDIEFWLPILKREDFETALYGLVELGASRVRLLDTEKTQRSWGGSKEMERAHRIMVAAAEQSKNFSLPEIIPPVSLAQAVAAHKTSATKLFFDPQGDSLWHVAGQVKEAAPERLILMVGPEGDLTDQEKELLRASGFTFCGLTPTVLRSVQAIQLSLGFFRALLAHR